MANGQYTLSFFRSGNFSLFISKIGTEKILLAKVKIKELEFMIDWLMLLISITLFFYLVLTLLTPEKF